MKHIKTPSKSNNLSIVAVLIVVAIFSYGIVRYEQKQKVTNQQAQAAVAKGEAAVQAQEKQQAALNAELVQAGSEKAQICNYIATQPKAKAVVVPPLCK